MKKQTNWYLLNWEYQIVDGHRKLVYIGEHYQFALLPIGLLRLKLAFAALLVGLITSFYVFTSLGAAGGKIIYIGMPVMLSQIPLLYLLCGVIWLMFVKPNMSYRDVRGSVTRIRFGGWVMLALLMVGCIGQLARIMFVLSGTADMKAEWGYFIGIVFCVADISTMQLLLHFFPVEVTPTGTGIMGTK